MSLPIQSSDPCPKCHASIAQLVNVSYIFELHGKPGDLGFMQALSAITYTLQCGVCGHKYAICEDASPPAG